MKAKNIVAMLAMTRVVLVATAGLSSSQTYEPTKRNTLELDGEKYVVIGGEKGFDLRPYVKTISKS